MTLAMAMILVGLLLIYAGIKGRSPLAILAGGKVKPSKRPAAVTR